jgi:hypothetical protein
MTKGDLQSFECEAESIHAQTRSDGEALDAHNPTSELSVLSRSHGRALAYRRLSMKNPNSTFCRAVALQVILIGAIPVGLSASIVSMLLHLRP